MNDSIYLERFSHGPFYRHLTISLGLLYLLYLTQLEEAEMVGRL